MLLWPFPRHGRRQSCLEACSLLYLLIDAAKTSIMMKSYPILYAQEVKWRKPWSAVFETFLRDLVFYFMIRLPFLSACPHRLIRSGCRSQLSWCGSIWCSLFLNWRAKTTVQRNGALGLSTSGCHLLLNMVTRLSGISPMILPPHNTLSHRHLWNQISVQWRSQTNIF